MGLVLLQAIPGFTQDPIPSNQLAALPLSLPSGGNALLFTMGSWCVLELQVNEIIECYASSLNCILNI